MRAVIAICKVGIHVACAYLHDSVGLSQMSNLNCSAKWLGLFSFRQHPLDPGGRLERHACAVEGHWLAGFVGGVIASLDTLTCNRHTIHYFVVSRDLAHAVYGVRVVGDSAWSSGGQSQHSPVRLYIQANPRRILARKLKPPCGFPAKLPFGPMNRVDNEAVREEGVESKVPGMSVSNSGPSSAVLKPSSARCVGMITTPPRSKR